MAELHFTESGWTDYLYWQATDKKTLKRINDLLKECLRTPFEGKGKPEPLTGNYAGKWSRRINEKDPLRGSFSLYIRPPKDCPDIVFKSLLSAGTTLLNLTLLLRR